MWSVSPGVRSCTFRHTRSDSGDLVFLYQLEEAAGGAAASSQALAAAR